MSEFYVIVEFLEEEENGVMPMAIVSSTWITEDNGRMYCLWPEYYKNDMSRNKAVMQHIALDESKCGKSKINIKYRTEVYSRALQKFKQLETLSNVSQSDEHEVTSDTKKRPIKKSILLRDFEDISSNDDGDLPIPPRPPSIIGNIFHNNTPSISSVSSVSLRSIPLEPKLTTDNGDLTRSCELCQQNKVLITSVLKKIENMQQDLRFLIQIVSQGRPESNVIFDETNLIMSTVAELENNNNLLEDADHFAAKVSQLQLIGGHDIPDTTRRVISKLVRNELACSVNWSGRNGKDGFIKYKNIINLIIVSVRKNPLCANATQQEVEATIKSWLRNSSDREGGRSKRKTNIIN